MPDTLENPRAVAGSNRPPFQEWYGEQNAALPGYIDADIPDILKRVDELTAALGRLPETIADKDTAGNYAQLIGFLTKCIQAAEAKRVDLTAGPLTATRIIMTHFSERVFNKIGAPKTDKGGSWGGIKQLCQDRLTVWDREQARLERLRLQEEQRRADEAAAVLRRAQEEAERKRHEAEAAERAERAAREAKIRDEQDLAKAIAMEAEEKERQAQREAAARAAQAIAEQAQIDADRAAEAAAAKSSQLTHSVGAYGAKSSLKENWRFRIDDFDALDLNEVRAYLSSDDIQKAYNAAAKKIKTTRTLKGGVIFNDERSQVRA